MTAFKNIHIFLFVMLLFFPSVSSAIQANPAPDQNQGLFDSEEVIEIRLEGNIETLLNDRGEDPSYHIMTLHAQNENVDESLDIRVRVRGNFRRLKKNCDTPPLKLNFKDHEVPEHSIFAGQPELKLVVPCQGEQYVVREYLTYKLYNLITDHSFQVRMVSLTFDDTENGETSNSRHAFLIEDKEVMASRNNAALVERLNYRPEVIEKEAFFGMSVFAYMIGNTDWSIQFLHNVELMFSNTDNVFIAVPYDFDLVGFVSSPYARPEPALRLRSVRERVYRGYCLEDLSVLTGTFTLFQELKPEFYKTITENTLLDESYKSSAIEYLNDFYDTLNDEKDMTKAFSYPCSRYGTGNVVIRGMQDGG